MSREAFESALKEDRCDGDTRLVYADWLEERGFDDEAQEQRRRASPEWIEAARWMEVFVKSIGSDCVNYHEVWEDVQRQRDGGIDWRDITRLPDKWQEFTFDQVIQIAQHFADTLESEGDGEKFIQHGSEAARNSFDPETQKKFWEAWKVITGNDPGEAANDRPFCCTC